MPQVWGIRCFVKKEKVLSALIAFQLVAGQGTWMYPVVHAEDAPAEESVVHEGDKKGSAVVGGNYKKRYSNDEDGVAVSDDKKNSAEGVSSAVIGGSDNHAKGDNSVAIGGMGSDAEADDSIVGLGGKTTEKAKDSTVIGNGNSSSSKDTAIIGGKSNTVAEGSSRSAIVGGQNNTVDTSGLSYASSGYIIGGTGNTVKGGESVIIAGNENKIENSADSPNVKDANAIIAGNKNTISGTGSNDVIVGGESNTINDKYMLTHTTSGHNIIAGGQNNTIEGYYNDSGIFAGTDNKITSPNDHYTFTSPNGSVIVGGNNNTVNADQWGNGAYIFGGRSNIAEGAQSAIAGGKNNTSKGARSAIVAGSGNTSEGEDSFVGGGSGNKVTGNYSFVAGGEKNTGEGKGSFVGAGYENSATGIASAVFGVRNFATGWHAFIGGGEDNIAQGFNSAIIGGDEVLASGDNSIVLGGYGLRDRDSDSDPWTYTHKATGRYSTLIGGSSSVASGYRSTILNGSDSTASGNNSIIVGGGENNLASGDYSIIVGGGEDNLATGAQSVIIGGGEDNLATGAQSVIIGSERIQTSGHNAIAIGTKGTRTQSKDDNGNTVYTYNSVVSGEFSVMLGGESNSVSGNKSIIAGGSNNINKGTNSAIIGGTSNNNSGYDSVNIGGFNNKINFYGDNSVNIGGSNNKIYSRNSIALGGTDNIVAGNNSIAAQGGRAYGDASTAIGSGAIAYKANTIAIGTNSINDTEDTVSFGRKASDKNYTLEQKWMPYRSGGYTSRDGMSGASYEYILRDSDGNVVNLATDGSMQLFKAGTYTLSYDYSSWHIDSATGKKVVDYTYQSTSDETTLDKDMYGSTTLADQGSGTLQTTNFYTLDESAPTTAITRRLTNVSRGVDGTDAVNVSQLKDAINEAKFDPTTGGDDPLNVKYDSLQKTSVTLGGDTGTQIKNVAEGTDGTDAVNLNQLNKAIANINISGGGGNDKNAVHYDGDDHTKVSLTGEGGTIITNVKDGEISDTSKDAINGSQLKVEQDERKDADDKLDKRIGTLDVKTYNYIDASNNVSQNLQALDDAITNGGGGDCLVKDNGKKITIAQKSNTNIIDIRGGNDNRRTITGVQTNPSDGSSAVSVDYLNDQIDGMKDDMKGIGAGAAALAGLHPLPYDPKNRVSYATSIGSYEGKTAFALGAFYQAKRDLLFSIGGAFSNGTMMNLGVAGRFGKTTEEAYGNGGAGGAGISPELAAEIERLRTENATMHERNEQLMGEVATLKEENEYVRKKSNWFLGVAHNMYEKMRTMTGRDEDWEFVKKDKEKGMVSGK